MKRFSGTISDVSAKKASSSRYSFVLSSDWLGVTSPTITALLSAVFSNSSVSLFICSYYINKRFALPHGWANPSLFHIICLFVILLFTSLQCEVTNLWLDCLVSQFVPVVAAWQILAVALAVPACLYVIVVA